MVFLNYDNDQGIGLRLSHLINRFSIADFGFVRVHKD